MTESDVVDEAFEHFRQYGGHKRRFREAMHHLTVLGRMAKAVARGDYELAAPKIALMLATLGYVVSPVDALPELILGPLGLTDDASLLVATAGMLSFEVVSFLEWERSQSN